MLIVYSQFSCTCVNITYVSGVLCFVSVVSKHISQRLEQTNKQTLGKISKTGEYGHVAGPDGYLGKQCLYLDALETAKGRAYLFITVITRTFREKFREMMFITRVNNIASRKRHVFQTMKIDLH